MEDLKSVYGASDEQSALSNLERFDEKWGKKYPKTARSWKDNWVNLSTYFKYPQEVRTLIYTTNTIEGFNRQLRKANEIQNSISDRRLAAQNALPCDDRHNEEMDGQAQRLRIIHSQLEIYFPGRMG